MNKTISWDEAFKLVEDANVVSVESHSNMLIYPICFTNEQNEGDGATIELRPLFNKIQEIDINNIDLLRDKMFLLDEDLNKTVEVSENGNLIFNDTDDAKVEIALFTRMLIK